MLEEVAAIDWAKLSHSYGSAEETPTHLAALSSDSEQDQEKALNYFWGHMLEGGDVNPHVIPFLFEILDRAKEPMRPKLIDLLLALVFGWNWDFLPLGYCPDDERRIWKESDDANRAYGELHKRAALFTHYLRPHLGFETRIAAGFAVARLAKPLSGFHQEVAEYIKRPNHDPQLQNLVLTFGMLCRHARQPANVDVLIPFLQPDRSRTIRVNAATALVTALGPQAPDEAIQTLLTALEEAWEVESVRMNEQWWNEGDLLGYGALVLKLVGQDRRDEIARALCGALERVDACTHSIPCTLLEILFPERPPPAVWKPSEFDEVQLTSLNRLLRTRHWSDWMFSPTFVPFAREGDDYEGAMRQFLRDVTGKEKSVVEQESGSRQGNVSTWDFKHHFPKPDRDASEPG